MFAMDPDYDTDCVFWADIEKDIIMKQCLNNVDGSSPEPLVISSLQSVKGMAYDHHSKILNFVGNKKSIKFGKVNENREGRTRKTVLDFQPGRKPRASKPSRVGSSTLTGKTRPPALEDQDWMAQITRR